MFKSKWSYKKSKKIILIRAGSSNGRLPHALLSLAANLEDEVIIIDESNPVSIKKYKDDIT